MDDDKKIVREIPGDRSKAWKLWRVNPDGSKIELIAEADTREEVERRKTRLDWHYKIYHSRKLLD